MRANKLVWVELSDFSAFQYKRIFKTAASVKRALVEGCYAMTQVYYKDAVASIRHQLWLRCKGHCELCTADVTEQSGEMHEMKHRGRGGEISLDNSVFACPQCHRYQHRERNPQWSTKPAS